MTPDQEIRTAALEMAARIAMEALNDSWRKAPQARREVIRQVQEDVVGIARRFEHYIRSGA